MISHSCSTNNTFHMIKHDPNVLQIPFRLHSCDKANSTPDTIYRHLENEHLLSMNLSWEIILLDVVIPTLGLQLKYVINIATFLMMFERSNKVTDVGKVKFTEPILECSSYSPFKSFSVPLLKSLSK
jgi:hypothetical protein